MAGLWLPALTWNTVFFWNLDVQVAVECLMVRQQFNGQSKDWDGRRKQTLKLFFFSPTSSTWANPISSWSRMTESIEFWYFIPTEDLVFLVNFIRFSLKLLKSFPKNVSEEHRPLLTKLSTELIDQDEQTHFKSFGIRDFNVKIQGECEYIFWWFFLFPLFF